MTISNIRVRASLAVVGGVMSLWGYHAMVWCWSIRWEVPGGVADMMQFQQVLRFGNDGAQFLDITRQIDSAVARHHVGTGLVSVFIRHTSASLTIQENADPSVLSDLTHTLEKLAPEGGHYRHSSEGPDDMPAHIKSMLTATSLSIPVTDGRMVLGTWQGIYLIEHRRAPHVREVVVHYVGEAGAGG